MYERRESDPQCEVYAGEHPWYTVRRLTADGAIELIARVRCPSDAEVIAAMLNTPDIYNAALRLVHANAS